jgi:hypothetical protein
MLHMANDQDSTLDTDGSVIPDPRYIPTPQIEIGRTEYTDDQWRVAIAAIDDAEREVLKAREVKRRAETAYEMALTGRVRVQIVRDLMIATDTRRPARVSRCAGVSRARCAIIRTGVVREWTRRGIDPYGVVAATPTDDHPDSADQ